MARMGWNSGGLVVEIVCEVEKTARFYRDAACLTANLPADTVMNLEKGRLKFLYPPVGRPSRGSLVAADVKLTHMP